MFSHGKFSAVSKGSMSSDSTVPAELKWGVSVHCILGKKEAVAAAHRSHLSKKSVAVAVARESGPHCEGHEKGAAA